MFHRATKVKVMNGYYNSSACINYICAAKGKGSSPTIWSFSVEAMLLLDHIS